MKILVTGFEPFGESPLNPSQKLIEAIPEKPFDGIAVLKAILPVDHTQAPKQLIAHIHKHQPDAVISFGLASGRPKISLERVAINLMDFRIPDNAGFTISDQPVIEGGPAAYFSTLPIRSLLEALGKAQIPSEISLSAGAYLCNQVFYSMMHEIHRANLAIMAGFIHLPALPEQAAQSSKSIPSISLEQDIMAAKIIISHLG